MRAQNDAEKLFSENRNLIYAALSRYVPQMAFDEDMQQIAGIGLWKACLAFDEGTGAKFATFAYRCIRNEVYVELRGRKRREPETPPLSLHQRVSEDCPLTWAEVVAGSADVGWTDIKGLYDTLSERQQFILRERIRGTKVKDCAAALHISVETYHREWRKIQKKWSKFI